MTQNQSIQSILDERRENIEEIRSGHELYEDDIDLTVTFEHLSEPQAIALMAMFNAWRQCGKWGMSRWVSFYVDGDGGFRPNPSYDLDGSPIGPSVEGFEELAESAEVEENRFDSDSIGWWFIDQAVDDDEDHS